MWSPNKDKIEPGEVLGRRIFSDKIFEANGRFRIDHFLDDRVDHDLSVDRLGNGAPIKKVISKLTPIICAERENCEGWAALKYSSISKPKSVALSVHPTPTNSNDYHADINRDDYRTKQSAYSLAFRLRDAACGDFPELVALADKVESSTSNQQ